MRTRVQAKRQKTADKAPQKPWAKLQPRPFAAESESATDAAPPLNQAQVDRVAHAPNLAAMPLYATDAIASSGMGGAAVQAKEKAEPNLKSPQGTLQRQAEDQKAQEELLQKQVEPAQDEEDLLQMQPAPAEEDQLQMQLEDKEERAVQEKAEVGTEVKKDEEVQTQLETEEEETLQRQAEAEDAEAAVMETEEDLAIAQTKKAK